MSHLLPHHLHLAFHLLLPLSLTRSPGLGQWRRQSLTQEQWLRQCLHQQRWIRRLMHLHLHLTVPTLQLTLTQRVHMHLQQWAPRRLHLRVQWWTRQHPHLWLHLYLYLQWWTHQHLRLQQWSCPRLRSLPGTHQRCRLHQRQWPC